MTTHVLPTPWCFLGTLHNDCNGAGPLYSCPDSTVWPSATLPCHALVSVPVPVTGAADIVSSLAAGSVLVMCGILLFCFWSIIFRGPLGRMGGDDDDQS